MRYPVGRDTQRRQAQLLVNEDICPAHREVPRARPIRGKADVTRVMRGHETDECSRPAERAVDPGLVSPLYHLEYGLVIGATDDILNDGTASSPFDGGDCSPLRLRGKVNPSSDHRSRLLRQESGNHLLSCRGQGCTARIVILLGLRGWLLRHHSVGQEFAVQRDDHPVAAGVGFAPDVQAEADRAQGVDAIAELLVDELLGSSGRRPGAPHRTGRSSGRPVPPTPARPGVGWSCRACVTSSPSSSSDPAALAWAGSSAAAQQRRCRPGHRSSHLLGQLGPGLRPPGLGRPDRLGGLLFGQHHVPPAMCAARTALPPRYAAHVPRT